MPSRRRAHRRATVATTRPRSGTPPAAKNMTGTVVSSSSSMTRGLVRPTYAITTSRAVARSRASPCSDDAVHSDDQRSGWAVRVDGRHREPHGEGSRRPESIGVHARFRHPVPVGSCGRSVGSGHDPGAGVDRSGPQGGRHRTRAGDGRRAEGRQRPPGHGDEPGAGGVPPVPEGDAARPGRPRTGCRATGSC